MSEAHEATARPVKVTGLCSSTRVYYEAAQSKRHSSCS